MVNILFIYQVLSTLTDVLHYCDPHIEKFKQRSGSLPQIFSGLRGFNLWQESRRKFPEVNYGLLNFLVVVTSTSN